MGDARAEPQASKNFSGLNAQRRAWLSTHLKHAAGVLGVTPIGVPVFGWHDRTIGTRVKTTDGEHWLRVVAELSYWASGAFWTGNLDAQAISGVPKLSFSPTSTGPTTTAGYAPNS